ncbi:MAG: hypothetical protein NTV48_00500 [Candidatus Vogelbacteria bacterium]|nr:hypothetical protein [Candidatus Vogelbacteria bacterium]
MVVINIDKYLRKEVSTLSEKNHVVRLKPAQVGAIGSYFEHLAISAYEQFCFMTNYQGVQIEEWCEVLR